MLALDGDEDVEGGAAGLSLDARLKLVSTLRPHAEALSGVSIQSRLAARSSVMV